MALPLVAIVGRPNVGKSSLLNMLAGRRISIVDPTAGVTRDRIQALCEHDGIYFDVVDTGEGVNPLDREVTEWLRKSGRPVFLLANKVDAPNTATELAEFHKLGFG